MSRLSFLELEARNYEAIKSPQMCRIAYLEGEVAKLRSDAASYPSYYYSVLLQCRERERNALIQSMRDKIRVVSNNDVTPESNRESVS